MCDGWVGGVKLASRSNHEVCVMLFMFMSLRRLHKHITCGAHSQNFGAPLTERLLTSLSNCDSGASPQSMPPPEDRELSEGEVMVCRLEP